MAIALFDTNILVKVACKMTLAQQAQFDALLAASGIAHLNDDIMVRAAAIRRDSIANPPKIALPDGIIRASAKVSGRIIVTRNPADFGGAGPMVRAPYEIVNAAAVNVAPAPI